MQLTKTKQEAARSAFGKLYSAARSSLEVTYQVQEVQSAIYEEWRVISSTSWMEIFHKSVLRRTLTATAFNAGGSISGAFFIFTYAAVFLQEVGIDNPIEINEILNACILAGVMGCWPTC